MKSVKVKGGIYWETQYIIIIIDLNLSSFTFDYQMDSLFTRVFYTLRSNQILEEMHPQYNE